MKSFYRKALGTLTSLITLGTLFPSTIPSSSFADSDSILLGDANGDGYVTYADATTVLEYLSGVINPDAERVTCMDINEDYVIDKTDYFKINHLVSTGQNTVNNNPSLSSNKTLYSLPNFEGRDYYIHDCSSNNPASRVGYTLNLPNPSNQQNRTINLRSTDSSDLENLNVVRITTSSGTWGSGFLISNHIVATAAHVVFSSNSFETGVTISIYANSEATQENLLKSCSASEIHIPRDYVFESGGTEVNYDYALIYVDSDLTQINNTNYTISPFSLGVATNEFMDTSAALTTSGFRNVTVNNSNRIFRYYSTGQVKNMVTLFGNSLDGNDPEMRMYSEGYSISGKSGGPVYRDTDYYSQSIRSVLGITTGASPTTHNTWSDRITPTLLQFYYNNPYINT